MASPEKLKKYQKEKFESYKKINNLKVNDNEAYIEIQISQPIIYITPYKISLYMFIIRNKIKKSCFSAKKCCDKTGFFAQPPETGEPCTCALLPIIPGSFENGCLLHL